MKQRDQVAMTPGQSAAMLAGGRKMQLATINPDGSVDELDEYVSRAARKRVGYAVEPARIIFWDHSRLQPEGG